MARREIAKIVPAVVGPKGKRVEGEKVTTREASSPHDAARHPRPGPCCVAGRSRPQRSAARLRLARDRRSPDAEAALQPLDLVRGNAHRKVEPVLFVTAAHDLGMFIKPMQALPVAQVEQEFEFRPAASQAILDRGQKMIDPFARRRGNGERCGLPGAVLSSQRRARVGVKQVHLVPDLDDAIGVVGDANLVQDRLDVMGLRFAVHVGNVAHVHDDVGRAHLLERGAKGGNERRRQAPR